MKKEDKIPDLPARTWNRIICAVNCRIPPEQVNLKTEAEQLCYARMWKEAEAMQAKHGHWPEFALCELD